MLYSGDTALKERKIAHRFDKVSANLRTVIEEMSIL